MSLTDYLTIAPWVPSLRSEQNGPKTHRKYIIYLIGEQCDWSIELFNRWELMLDNVEKIALTSGYLPVFGRCDWGLSLHRSHCPHRHNQRYRVDIVYLLYLFFASSHYRHSNEFNMFVYAFDFEIEKEIKSCQHCDINNIYSMRGTGPNEKIAIILISNSYRQ